VADEVQEMLDRRARGIVHTVPKHESWTEAMASAESDAPWIIPGMLRRDWRCVIVGGEGKGKSVLLRQLAMLAAQGLHPLWPTQRIAAVRTLVVDLENPLAAIAETGRRMDLMLQRDSDYDSSRAHVWREPGGIDLRTPIGAGALEREVFDFKPDLVVVGPLYKATVQRERERYEEVAAGVQHTLDDLRTRYNFALILEHHAPHGDRGKRTMRPEGSSWWLRWGELGIGLEPDLTLSRWRGDRLLNGWPDSLSRSDVWPFVGVWDNGFPLEEEEMF